MCVCKCIEEWKEFNCLFIVCHFGLNVCCRTNKMFFRSCFRISAVSLKNTCWPPFLSISIQVKQSFFQRFLTCKFYVRSIEECYNNHVSNSGEPCPTPQWSFGFINNRHTVSLDWAILTILYFDTWFSRSHDWDFHTLGCKPQIDPNHVGISAVEINDFPPAPGSRPKACQEGKRLALSCCCS